MVVGPGGLPRVLWLSSFGGAAPVVTWRIARHTGAPRPGPVVARRIAGYTEGRTASPRRDNPVLAPVVARRIARYTEGRNGLASRRGSGRRWSSERGRLSIGARGAARLGGGRLWFQSPGVRIFIRSRGPLLGAIVASASLPAAARSLRPVPALTSLRLRTAAYLEQNLLAEGGRVRRFCWGAATRWCELECVCLCSHSREEVPSFPLLAPALPVFATHNTTCVFRHLDVLKLRHW